MNTKTPWRLLLSLADHELAQATRKLGEVLTVLGKLTSQRESLAAAADHYRPEPGPAIPIALLNNARAFHAKLVSTIAGMDQQITQERLRHAQAVEAWTAIKARRDGYEKLLESSVRERREQLDKIDESNLEDMIQNSAEARRRLGHREDE